MVIKGHIELNIMLNRKFLRYLREFQSFSFSFFFYSYVHTMFGSFLPQLFS
jgi:hypothetical protein